jgi:hypothetical protein
VRRRSTVVAWFVIAGVLAAVGIGLTPGEVGHCLLPTLAPLATTLPLAVLAVIVGAWPYVLVDDDALRIHNGFTWFEVPYSAIDTVRETRLGLLVRTHAGKQIPITAYASGAFRRLLGHQELAEALINKIDGHTYSIPESTPADPVIRHFDTRNILIALATIAVGAAVIVGATHTYK